MDLHEYLTLRGADLAGVVTAVDTAVGLGSQDVLLAVGSLVEGLGTPKSDVDLLLLTPRAANSLPSGEVALVVSRCLIDMRIMPVEELSLLLTRFETWSELEWSVTHTAKFSLEERTLLHRLRHGSIIRRGEEEGILQRVPQVRELARLKLQVARHMARTIQVDMVGNRARQDYRSLTFAAQDLLGHALDALLAGHLRTNPLAKWRSRLLEALPADSLSALPLRIVARDPGEEAWRLHRAPERPDATACLEHAFRISTFARAVFAWAERKLSTDTPPPAGLSMSVSANSGSRMLGLDFDVDFMYTGTGVALGRLNEFGTSLELSVDEFWLVLQFDEITRFYTDEQNDDFPGETPSIGTADLLLARVMSAGLCVSPSTDIVAPEHEA